MTVRRRADGQPEQPLTWGLVILFSFVILARFASAKFWSFCCKYALRNTQNDCHCDGHGSSWGTWPTGAVSRLVRWGKTRQCRKPISERDKRYKIPLHALHSVYDLVCVCNITTYSVESAPVYMCIKDVYTYILLVWYVTRRWTSPYEVPRHPASKRYQQEQ